MRLGNCRIGQSDNFPQIAANKGWQSIERYKKRSKIVHVTLQKRYINKTVTA